ncbi:MAG: hypothetical protein VKS61_04900 [Candidatus Sericytochromatia bacterium]|nr:hypothetical protein [Candidatus Sericytochromatia bacterium]MEB3221396.1 hypothetical protein [Candidatus Sericytochromatia bacterium]
MAPGRLLGWWIGLTLALQAAAGAAPVRPAGERLDEALRQVRVRLGFVALAGSPLLRDEAEGEVLRAFAAGLAAAVEGGAIVPERHARLQEAGLAIDQRFPEAPYRLVVDAGDGLPAITMRLRRHPWSTLHGLPLLGWRTHGIGGGLLLRPVTWRPGPEVPTAYFE